MKGETLPANTSWAGIPCEQVRVKARNRPTPVLLQNVELPPVIAATARHKPALSGSVLERNPTDNLAVANV
jgi:hypothetical protein